MVSFFHTLSQAPVGITLLSGVAFVVEMANPRYLELVDKTEEELVGKPLFQTLPEVKDFISTILTDVLQTGIAFEGREFAAPLKRNGKTELAYFDFIYQPIKDLAGKYTQVLVVAIEVTDSVNNKKALQESERQFRQLVTQSPIPIAIFMGHDFTIEMGNDRMFSDIWRKKKEDITGKPLIEAFPELKHQKFPDLLKKVYEEGTKYSEKEALAIVAGDDGDRADPRPIQSAPRRRQNRSDAPSPFPPANASNDKWSPNHIRRGAGPPGFPCWSGDARGCAGHPESPAAAR